MLYARVGGAWVPVVANDEVWIAAAEPTDPGVELWYDTDDPGIGDMSKLPRGWVGHATTSSDVNFTSVTDVTGLTVTWTADPTRRYRVTCAIEVQGSVTPASLIVSVVNANASVLYNRKACSVPYANALPNLTIDYVESGLSGSQTRKVQAQASAGTGTVIGSSSYGPWLIIEDIGGV